MELIIIWSCIIITIGFLKFNNSKYILFSLIMLIVTYIYNILSLTIMSLKHAILLSIIPNSCIWYLAYVCNDFLWVYPYNWESFSTIFLIYSYILLYILCES